MLKFFHKKDKKPITKGVCKVPVVMQLEALECGAACLCMILAYYDKWVPLEKVRSDCGVSRDGSKAINVLKAARHYGLNADGYRYQTDYLKSHATFPCIIFWNLNHFVVLNGFRGNKAYINDPGHGTYSVDMDSFNAQYSGICLQFEPTDKFVPGGKQKSVLAFTKKYLKGTGAILTFTILTAAVSALLGVLAPAFSRVFLDRLLTGNTPEWVVPFFIFLGVFNAIQIIIGIINAVYVLRLNGKTAVLGETKFMWKVFHLPMVFFSQRMAGDIQGRKSSNAGVSQSLINLFVPLLINTVMVVVYFVVMIRCSWILTLVGLSSIGINSLVSNYISKKRINISRVATRDSAKLDAATIAGIEMIETIKASGAENGYFAKWSGHQANVQSSQVKNLKLNTYLGMIPSLTSTIANDLVLLIGVYLTFQGEFTVGLIMQFQGFLTAFMTPVNTFITSGQQIQEMRTNMERIDDVMEYPDDDAFMKESNLNNIECSKLTGNIILKDVTFGYSPLDKPLIENFNLTLTPGKSVALVGNSGCGKSTISKLISGLYQPWKGQILFDKKPTKKIDKNIFSSSLAVVDQDIILFEDTIKNNIKMWDNSIEDYEVILAAKDAQLHDDIVARNGGYEYKIRENGADFSGGQRQRMEIARVLAQDPTIIIMDEATSALDAKTEYEVVKSIRRRGITSIVVAHRLSTIRSCDEILVMNQGKVIARGTHKYLMSNCKYYKNLVTSE